MHNSYRIFYMNNYKTTFWDRDQALNWIAQEVAHGAHWEDFEIRDNSDYL
jgi:hypothetical protein